MRFLSITKPGIIFGNLITVSGAFFLGSQGQIDLGLFFFTLLGMSLIIASGCVFNNIIDRDIDRLMERTKNRVLAQERMTLKTAIIYAISLGILGIALLYYETNPLTVLIALIGLFFYVVVYSLLLKRKSIYGTIIGGVAGAVPPVVGYCAVTNRFDMGALLLFLILFTWQIPHFYAISIYRLKDFAAAAIPILPVKKSIHYTKISMVLYVVAFTFTAIMPTLFGYTGIIYFVVAIAIGLTWLYFALSGFFVQDDQKWSRQMFLISIVNITLLSLMLAIN